MRQIHLMRSLAGGALLLAGLGGIALAQQDKNSVRTPNGLGFADFQGYEGWQVVSVSATPGVIDVIVGNPAMIAAYNTGLPAEGRKFPDGVKMAKIHWTTAQNSEGGSPATVPSALRDIDFMVRDATRFAASGGWGYAQFNYDAAKDSFTPLGTGSACGFACHTKVVAKDYVFTRFPKR